MPDQRKIITALFCDLVGSTELSGVLEPETLRTVVLRYFDTMRATIETYGGTVEKFIGDAVMAVFGVPVVREDDAHRAAAAALGMLAALDGLNADLERDVGATLAVRIGVNTGEAVTSGGASGQTMVSGEVVNVAARLEQAARQGTVLIGPTTRQLLGAAALGGDVGPLALKGKRDPVPGFRLTGLARGRERRPGAPLVGRGAELARLAALWEPVCGGGAGRLAVVCGEAGIGKSRLLREWLAAPVRQGALTGTGRCLAYGDEPSLAPLADAVRALLDAAGRAGLPPPEGHGLGVLRAGLLSDGTPSPSPEGTFAAVAAVLGRLAADRPLVLVLDDLQWSRPLLLDAVARLRAALPRTRLLLVCAGRAEPGGEGGWAAALGAQGQAAAGAATPHTTPQTAAPTAGAGTVEVLRLGPLAEADCHALAAELTPRQESDAARASADAVVRAEGNPLFLEQLLAILADGTGGTGGAGPGGLPTSVTAVLAARIDTLAAAERTVLDAGCVVGRRFRTADVRGLLGEEFGDPGPALAGLVGRGLVEQVPDGAEDRYQFGSGLLRDVAYGGLSKRRRAEWHERLARTPGIPPTAAAHHTERAYTHLRDLGRRDAHTEALRGRAARALADAGRRALTRADVPWSADLYERAVALSAAEDAWWPTAAQGLGETWLALGRTGGGAALLRSVLAGAEASGDRLAHAHARLQLTSLDAAAEAGAAAAAARDGLAVFEAAGDRLGQARAYVRLAQEQQSGGRHRRAVELLAAALGHAVAAGAAPELAMALGALGVSLWHGPTPAPDAVRRCRALLAEYGPGHAVVLVTLNYPLANLLALCGRFPEARDCLATADRCAADLGYAEVAVLAPLFAAGVEALAGAAEEAERLLVSAVERCGAAGGPALLGAASRDLARVRLRRGRPPEPLPAARGGALPPGDAADDLGVRALAEAAAGRAARGRELALRAVAAADSTDSPLARATARLDLARVLLAAAPPERGGGAGAAAAASEAAGEAAGEAARLFLAKGHVVGAAEARSLMAAGGAGRVEHAGHLARAAAHRGPGPTAEHTGGGR
ncbi:ATP-binding protein [Streptomyces sp. NPDC050560]|uniref:ATP-binding protein n=1 Tax=Streptomyces sp. NPDC050560 TaxID=3365630 RepID=UPI0037AEAAFD